jgi:methionyl-tRNA synthetase
MGKFFVTTPIYYVNDVPHIGHAYTTIAADVLARYHRLMGDDVFFLTGTDEHGQNIQRIAAEKRVSEKEYCDSIVAQFKRLWQMLDISHDYFVRTTDERHIVAVQKFARALLASGDVYRGQYKGWYCPRCEAFYEPEELLPSRPTDGGTEYQENVCPVHQRSCEWTEEQNYFFALSRYQDRLYHLIAETEFVLPETRRNELLGVLRQGLQDFSISRERVRWGVPLPDDPQQVLYVWVDALLNYITAIGYGDDQQTFQRYWPANVQLMAKEIIRFHCLYWPAMLMAVGLPVPRLVFAHGWLTKDGQKLSKTTGNTIDPFDLVRRFGSDAMRFLFLREGAFGADWDYTDSAFIRRYNADLANDLGNLLNRTVQMVVRYFAGTVPAPAGELETVDRQLLNLATGLGAAIESALERVALHEVLTLTGNLVEEANKYVQLTAPWELAKARKAGDARAGERLATVLYNLVDVLRVLGYCLEPVMPRKAPELLSQLGLDPAAKPTWSQCAAVGSYPAGTTVKPGPVLFPRYEA